METEVPLISAMQAFSVTAKFESLVPAKGELCIHKGLLSRNKRERIVIIPRKWLECLPVQNKVRVQCPLKNVLGVKCVRGKLNVN